MSLDKAREKVQAMQAKLPGGRCFARFLDLMLLDADLADERSFISKKLTKDEAAGVYAAAAAALLHAAAAALIPRFLHLISFIHS